MTDVSVIYADQTTLDDVTMLEQSAFIEKSALVEQADSTTENPVEEVKQSAAIEPTGRLHEVNKRFNAHVSACLAKVHLLSGARLIQNNHAHIKRLL